ncbi:phosphoglucomutase 1 [Rickenella mellea]|uniref:Phosphoglucomutase 1 n=1 Tax=Rickenella mellea TaxID=50990 RepID=A0A4Y7QCR4_9AGAM|nr:phosphoglucomutase 1 [Rickenella mellea]
MDTSLDKLIQNWLVLDKNVITRNEIQSLVATEQFAELDLRMRTRIEFGTAGLRGKMQAGWSSMNDLITIQTSQGLCAYTLQNVHDAANKGVVIGHDHRHNSQRWASLTAAAFLVKGMKVYQLRGLNHTPLVPFSVSRVGAACGVMITASHNPKQDNGYKVYWENAVQIISPHDKGISDAIKDNLEPISWDVNLVNSSPLCLDRTDELRETYFGNLLELRLPRAIIPANAVKFVNTSMHGVSHAFAVKAFEAFGLEPFFSVKTQEKPDPEFPTVGFPNPEEKGALRLAIHEANAVGAAYVLAQDPDADRFAAAEKGADGEWILFTGDQIGAVFAARALEAYINSGNPMEKLAMVTSTVSSKFVEAMAAKEGFKFVECLTGFKFIGNAALNLVAQGFDVPFGYEEAIGFMIGSTIRDKDGIAATVCFAELAVTLAHKGLTVSSFLSQLYQKYGYFKTSNGYFVCHYPPTIDRIFARIRNYDSQKKRYQSYPKEIAGLMVVSVRDLTVGFDSANPPTYQPSLPLSSGHMIQFRAQSQTDDTKIVLTLRSHNSCYNVNVNVQIKYYLEGSGSDVPKIHQLLPNVVDELRKEWLEADKNDLQCP